MKPKIISVSRRTDVPAFYTPWFVNRIREGYCVYPNPLYPRKYYRVSLRPQDVLGIVFWTRHPSPLTPYLDELDAAGFTYYFQYTVVGYPKTIDLRSPSLSIAARTFKELSGRIGPDRVIWRYDPIILNRELTFAWHRDNFRRIADIIAPDTHRVVVSIVDPYARTQRRVGTPDDGVKYAPEDYTELLHMIVSEASDRGIRVQSCAEASLRVEGITPGSCVDASLIHTLSGRTTPARWRMHKQREGCLCSESVDIGVNESCGFGCQYCYATKNHARALDTLKKHRPEWNCITGDVHMDEPEEKTPVQQTLF